MNFSSVSFSSSTFYASLLMHLHHSKCTHNLSPETGFQNTTLTNFRPGSRSEAAIFNQPCFGICAEGQLAQHTAFGTGAEAQLRQNTAFGTGAEAQLPQNTAFGTCSEAPISTNTCPGTCSGGYIAGNTALGTSFLTKF